MATETATKQSEGIVNFASGSITGDGTAVAATLGFKPRHIRVFNETDAIVWEKFADQAAANSLKILSHDTTQVAKDTGSAIVIKDAIADGYAGFLLSATLAASGKALVWSAWG